MHGLRFFFGGGYFAIKVPKICAFGQVSAAFAFQVFAHVMLDGVEHPIGVPTIDVQGIGFSHAAIMRSRCASASGLDNGPAERERLVSMSAVLAICIGACVGALARWQLGLHFNSTGVLPWGTLYANLIGGYLIGVCVAVFQALPDLDPLWRLLLVTGFLGALTTFSSFSAEVVHMLLASRYVSALVTASLHLLGSLICTFAGIKTIEMIWFR
jgi:CrcB protein